MKYLLIFIGFIIFTNQIYGQNIDSIFNEIDQIETIEDQISELAHYSTSYANKNFEFSAQCISKAENIAATLNDSCAFCTIHLTKGIISHKISKYEDAFMHYHNAYQCAKTCHNLYVLIHSTNNIGVLNVIAENHEKALEWYKLSLRFSREYNDTLETLYTLNNIGNMYNASRDPKNAIKYYQECVDLLELVPQYHYFYTTVYTNFAYAYYANGDRKKAIELYESSLSLLDTLDRPYHHAVTLKSLAELYLEEKDAHKALIYLNKAKTYYPRIENKKSEASYYFVRYKIQLELGNYEAALQDLETHQMLQDSIDINSMHVLITDIQEKYENEKLKQLNIKKDETIENRNRMLRYIGLIGVLLLILLVFYIQSNRYRKKTNYELRKKQNTINEGLNYGRFVKEKLMLSDRNLIVNNGLNFFIFDKPRDRVGGDFHLIRKHRDGIFIILGDATGHGIPGGFISLTVLNLFHKELQQDKNIQASELLINVLKEWKNISNLKDTYDESFTAAVVYIKENHVETAHYRQKSIIISKNEHTILGKKTNHIAKIQNEIFDMKKGEWIVLSTDGYYDQLGEGSNKTYRFNNFTRFIQSEINTGASDMGNTVRIEHICHKGKLEQTDDILVIGIGF